MKEGNFHYLYFDTKDFTGTYTTSGYSSEHTPFTFIPVFDDGEGTPLSNKKIVWDFGDGTKSTDVEPSHFYKNPGFYTVRCHFIGSGGTGYVDNFAQTIYVKNIYEDSITFPDKNINNIISETGLDERLQIAVNINRTNSWQTYQSLSSTGYNINIDINGSNSAPLNVDEYNKDKYGHLKPSARIIGEVFNVDSQTNDFAPIIKTETTNQEIYAVYNNGSFVIDGITKDDENSIFVGTSGASTVYFVDDIFNENEDGTFIEIISAFISCYFDTTNFMDSPMNPNQKITLLNSIKSVVRVEKEFDNIVPSELSITSNGLDIDGIDSDRNGIISDRFNITPTKFVGTKIPFVVKANDIYNFTCKYFDQMTRVLSAVNLQSGQVYVDIRDSNGTPLTGGYTIHDNFDSLSSVQVGGFYKGYVIFTEPHESIRIYANAALQIQTNNLIRVNDNIIHQKNVGVVYDLSLAEITAEINQTNITTGLSSVEATAVYSSSLAGTDFIWFTDSQTGSIGKYDKNTSTTSILQLSTISTQLVSSFPLSIASDLSGNAWVTLANTLSTIRINADTLTIDRVAAPSASNLIPSNVGLDSDGFLWVTYLEDTLSASHISKYEIGDPSVTQLNTISFDTDYLASDFVVDKSDNVWLIGKDKENVPTILDKNDVIIKIDPDLVVTYVTLPNSGSYWDLTLDVNQNLFITKDYSYVVYYNTTTELGLFYNIGNAYIDNGYESPLVGIGSNQQSIIFIVDSYNRKVHYFNSLYSIGVFNTFTLTAAGSGNIRAYGDWTGFRQLNNATSPADLGAVLIDNYSSVFSSLLESDILDVRKKNENHNPLKQYKSYLSQPYLKDKHHLNDDFMGTIIGTLSSDPNVLGKKIYEKISNFSDNISDVDTCNITSLKSMYEMMGEDFYTYTIKNYDTPADLYRVIDLLSIKFSKLRGSRNKYAEDFNDYGYDRKSIIDMGGTVQYGKNKGDQLDFFTTELVTGNESVPIIAYERFSETYKLINTNLLSSAFVEFREDAAWVLQQENGVPEINDNWILQEGGENIGSEQFIGDPLQFNYVYSLSSYNENWGWGLILPESGWTASDIPKYYTFFEYVSGFENSQNEGVINWADALTTVSESISSKDDWDNARVDIIYKTLSKGLQLI